jgi:hypothetical protein
MSELNEFILIRHRPDCNALSAARNLPAGAGGPPPTTWLMTKTAWCLLACVTVAKTAAAVAERNPSSGGNGKDPISADT